MVEARGGLLHPAHDGRPLHLAEDDEGALGRRLLVGLQQVGRVVDDLEELAHAEVRRGGGGSVEGHDGRGDGVGGVLLLREVNLGNCEKNRLEKGRTFFPNQSKK